MRIKNHFHINGFALSLALKKSLWATRKWSIPPFSAIYLLLTPLLCFFLFSVCCFLSSPFFSALASGAFYRESLLARRLISVYEANFSFIPSCTRSSSKCLPSLYHGRCSKTTYDKLLLLEISKCLYCFPNFTVIIVTSI